MHTDTITIGLFGYGCVGRGFYQLVSQQHAPLQITRICVRDAEKPRDIDSALFTTDPDALLLDPEIDIIVELISDADAAYQIVRRGLELRKPVVSANKKMIATHLETLIELQNTYHTPLLYEGAVGGSIPVIRTLENYFDKEPVHRISGIVNGSTNYILTRMAQEGADYQTALRAAQEQGYAEEDPTLDVEAYDPAFKLSILILHAFGVHVDPGKIKRIGITGIQDEERSFAQAQAGSIKLIAHAQRHRHGITAYVLPHVIPARSALSHIQYESNGIEVQAAWSDTQLFTGKGAGSLPTGSAVLSDVLSLIRSAGYAYQKRIPGYVEPADSLLRIYLRAPAELPDFGVLFEAVEICETIQGQTFFIGTIHLNTLFNHDHIRDPRVSVLALPETLTLEKGWLAGQLEVAVE